jgi:hypothetical protein
LRKLNAHASGSTPPGSSQTPSGQKKAVEERPETHGRTRTVGPSSLPRPQHVPPLPRPSPAASAARGENKLRQAAKSCDGAGGDDAHRWRRREEAGRRKRAALVALPRSRCRSREARRQAETAQDLARLACKGPVDLAYNPFYSACFFSRNNIFLS